MNTSLVISGYALYIFFGAFAFIFLGFIFYGCAYTFETRRSYKREYELKKLRKGYNELLGMYQRDCLKPTSKVKKER